MADKSFGVEELNLLGAGTPTIESPNSLNINASNVAISTNLTIGGQINSDVIIGNYNVGIGTTIPTSAVDSNNTQILNVGVVTANYFYGDGSGLSGVTGTVIEIQKDGTVVGSATTTINFATGILVDSSSGSGIVTVSSPRSAGGGGAGGKASYSDYASYSEFSHSTHNIVGLETSYCITGILTGSQTSGSILGATGGVYPYHQFGNDVRCSSDGNTIVISAQSDGFPGIGKTAVGLVYVYDRLGPDGKFEESILSASNGIGTNSSTYNDFFGSGIACSADGNTIYVGAIRKRSGGNQPCIYIFDRINRVGIQSYFEEVAIIEVEREPLRMVCSLDGNTLFVGNADTSDFPRNFNNDLVEVYDRVENDLSNVATINGQLPSGGTQGSSFGRSLACNFDGSSLIVGAPGYSWASPPAWESQARGAVLVYDREYQVGIGTTFTQVGILSGRDDDPHYEFGWSVACNSDASSIIVGEFEKSIPALGTPDTDGRSGVTGRVHVFDRKNCVGVGTTFTKVGILTGSASNDLDNQFGESLACSADGNTIFVGDIERRWDSLGEEYYWYTGQVYKFDRQGNDFIETKIINPGYPYNDELGWSIACSVDASTMIVSQIPQYGSDGRALVYDLETKEIPLVRAGIGSTALYIDCKVSIADTTSNAGGARYISTEVPSAGIGTEGDIWYDISGSAQYLNISALPSLP